jgi:hypothetical protein
MATRERTPRPSRVLAEGLRVLLEDLQPQIGCAGPVWRLFELE